MSGHFLEIEGGTYRQNVVCTAGPGAPCHMACPTCEGSCTCGKPPVDMGECNWILWLNEDDAMECGEGITRVPIDITWDGGAYRWTMADPYPSARVKLSELTFPPE